MKNIRNGKKRNTLGPCVVEPEVIFIFFFKLSIFSNFLKKFK